MIDACVVVLDRLAPDGAVLDGATLGGKGAALARLVRQGVPVPPTVVITAAAYRRVAADPELRAFLSGLCREDRVVDVEAIDQRFLSVPVPGDLEAEIAEAAAGLGGSVAVRSSATVEDLGEQSFAGQYRSLLDVGTEPTEVMRAVRLVWASLWHPAPLAYRRAWGISDVDAAMAVVLMQMVPAVRAGVAFTVDPGGRADDMRIEVVDGLGEALVSGARTPSVWLAPREGPWTPPRGAPPELSAVRDLAMTLEATTGAPVDVEWAATEERTWIVQSRPITVTVGAGDGFDTALDDHELTVEGIGEMVPGVLPPLRWEVVAFLVEEAIRSVLGSLGAIAPDADAQPFIRRVRGRAALDLSLLTQAGALIPGVTTADIEDQYFGRPGAAPVRTVTDWQPWRTAARDMRAAQMRRRCRFQGDVAVVAADRLDRGGPRPEDLDDDGLLALRLRLLDLGARAMAAELGVAATAAGAYARFEALLARHVGSDAAAREAQRVVTAEVERSVRPTSSRSIFAGPTWQEAGPSVPSMPERSGGDGRGWPDLEQRLVGDARWRRTRILSGQVVDVRLRLLRRALTDASVDLGRRERVKAAVLAIGGHVRRVHLELGRRLVERGLLGEATEVELLSQRELALAVRSGVGPPPVVLGRRRRRLATWEDDGPLPARFIGHPDRADEATEGQEELHGLAASPGRATGPVVVVDDPLRDVVPAGAVLVAAATDAAWSPLFVRAAAVVVERGGPLSHAAVVARELGVPAVLALAGARRALAGRTVTVDGDRGVVIVHPPTEDPPTSGDAAVGVPVR